MRMSAQIFAAGLRESIPHICAALQIDKAILNYKKAGEYRSFGVTGENFWGEPRGEFQQKLPGTFGSSSGTITFGRSLQEHTRSYCTVKGSP